MSGRCIIAGCQEVPVLRSPQLTVCASHIGCFLTQTQYNTGYSNWIVIDGAGGKTVLAQTAPTLNQQPGVAVPCVAVQNTSNLPLVNSKLTVVKSGSLPPVNTCSLPVVNSKLTAVNSGSLPAVNTSNVTTVNTSSLPAVRHAATQTELPAKRTVATQLCKKKRKNVRSAGIQATVLSTNRGVDTHTFSLDSPLLFLQPTMVKRPNKRPRLSVSDKEEEEEEEVDSSECS